MDNQHYGKYKIVEKIAKGGMGDVFKGYDPNIERYVAIKILRLGDFPDQGVRQQITERFLWEARIVGRLRHANMVTIYESGTHDGAPYIVMEYIGHTLDDLLKNEQEFTENEILIIMSQCCDALSYAHQSNVLHRDIKPSNILIEPENLFIKLTDFGIAKVPEMNGLTRAGEFLGTPGYMAPEQLRDVEVDGRADLFSLGVILYQLISGLKPFQGSSLSAVIAMLLNDDPVFELDVFIKPPYDAWIPMLRKALAKDREKRIQTVTEFKTALLSVHQADLPDGSATIPSGPDPSRIQPARTEPANESVGLAGRFQIRKLWMAICFLILVGAAAYVGKGFLFSNISHSQANLFRVNYEGKIDLSGVAHPVFRFGDGINVSITPSAECHFYILYLDSGRNITVLFPGNFSPGFSNPLIKGKTYHFPSPETSFTLGGNPGKEEIHVIGDEEPYQLIEPYAEKPSSAIPWSSFQTILRQVKNDQKAKKKFYTSFEYELVQ